MKKVFLIVFSICASLGIISAQSGCMNLFPDQKGATMTNKTYDGSNNLLSTTVYTVGDNYEYNDWDGTADISYQTVDASGSILSRGTLQVDCRDDNFYMKSVNTSIIPDSQGMVLDNVDLIGNFLDYPDTFADGIYSQTFEMDGGEFTIKTKDKADGFLRVRVYNRQYDKNEKVTTPAGDFDAAKITYTLEVYDSNTKKETTYQGVEWYSYKSGIVRAELYDQNKSLQAYSLLTDMSN
ncbi:MAG: hypothetical protein LUH15_19405 [Tannerellaceae bacterium]|nr:hypothetical protein [Tannerellaceae bacterium]